ncbi:MAG: hypothetical protein R3F39_23295 [Myxococcota bacterium]
MFRIAIAALVLMFSGAMGCDEGADNAYYLGYLPGPGQTVLVFEGTAARCKPNTSAPEGDPNRGKFTVGVTTEGTDGVLILSMQFTSLTEMPAAGSYNIPADATVTARVTPSGGSQTSLQFSGAFSVKAQGTTDGITISLPPSLPVSGTINCAP